MFVCVCVFIILGMSMPVIANMKSFAHAVVVLVGPSSCCCWSPKVVDWSHKNELIKLQPMCQNPLKVSDFSSWDNRMGSKQNNRQVCRQV